jgi:hypothetical protein
MVHSKFAPPRKCNQDRPAFHGLRQQQACRKMGTVARRKNPKSSSNSPNPMQARKFICLLDGPLFLRRSADQASNLCLGSKNAILWHWTGLLTPRWGRLVTWIARGTACGSCSSFSGVSRKTRIKSSTKLSVQAVTVVGISTAIGMAWLLGLHHAATRGWGCRAGQDSAILCGPNFGKVGSGLTGRSPSPRRSTKH